MSHRDDCPDPWTAEREGRRAGESGYRSRYSNPYADECEEASERWNRGYSSGVRIRKEREEEEHIQRLDRERHQLEAEQEREYYLQQDVYQYDYAADADRQYQQYCEQQYQQALEDDLYLGKIELALIAMAMEAHGF